MKKVNLTDVKENGLFVENVEGVGSKYVLNGNYYMVGKNGFHKV